MSAVFFIGFLGVDFRLCLRVVARFTHLSDDKAVAKMGHPGLWWFKPMSQKRDMGHPVRWWSRLHA